jgi:hypothetical protein
MKPPAAGINLTADQYGLGVLLWPPGGFSRLRASASLHSCRRYSSVSLDSWYGRMPSPPSWIPSSGSSLLVRVRKAFQIWGLDKRLLPRQRSRQGTQRSQRSLSLVYRLPINGHWIYDSGDEHRLWLRHRFPLRQGFKQGSSTVPGRCSLSDGGYCISLLFLTSTTTNLIGRRRYSGRRA